MGKAVVIKVNRVRIGVPVTWKRKVNWKLRDAKHWFLRLVKYE